MTTPLSPAQHQLQQGKAARRAGDLDTATTCFRNAIAADPACIPAYNNLANILQSQGEYAEAEHLYRQALALKPNQSVVHNNLGGLLQLIGKLDAAIEAYQRALEIQPGFDLALMNLGKAKVVQEDWTAALDCFDQVLRLQPTSTEAHLERGQVLTRLKRPHDALLAYEQALSLAPDMARAHLYTGVTLQEQHLYHLALGSLTRALELDPDPAVAWYNRGTALSRLLRCEEGLQDNLEAIARQPDYADAYWNAGLNSLLLGDLPTGWKYYEWRWKRTGADRRRYADRPLWTGEDITGKTILLHAEQGMGDTLQFCRYVPLVAARGARVLLEVYPAVATLCARIPGVAQVLPQDQEDGTVDFDCHLPLLSLPHIFGTTLQNIPAAVPYLRAPERRRQLWQQRLGPPTKPRVGLVWSGNPKHSLDHERSIPLERLSELFTPDCQWFSLQREVRDSDQDQLQRSGLTHFGEDLRDFADTAALIEHLDLVITVDTAVAHLAGALGRPVWIMLQYNPDWRWMLARTDSPWYPSARLFRQPLRNDWDSVIKAIIQAMHNALHPASDSTSKDYA